MTPCLLCTRQQRALCHDCRLRNKHDEEDSDAEDEELPLTQDEAVSQQAELDKHTEACNKVGLRGQGDAQR